jgi:hypothetical protein
MIPSAIAQRESTAPHLMAHESNYKENHVSNLEEAKNGID